MTWSATGFCSATRICATIWLFSWRSASGSWTRERTGWRDLCRRGRWDVSGTRPGMRTTCTRRTLRRSRSLTLSTRNWFSSGRRPFQLRWVLLFWNHLTFVRPRPDKCISKTLKLLLNLSFLKSLRFFCWRTRKFFFYLCL